MSDAVDMFSAMKDMRDVEKRVFGIPCPVCRQRLPKAHPKIMLPGSTCRAHKPHYRDPRIQPTSDKYNAAMIAAGEDWRQE